MLIELKKTNSSGISKRHLAKLIGVDPNSIQGKNLANNEKKLYW